MALRLGLQVRVLRVALVAGVNVALWLGFALAMQLVEGNHEAAYKCGETHSHIIR